MPLTDYVNSSLSDRLENSSGPLCSETRKGLGAHESFMPAGADQNGRAVRAIQKGSPPGWIKTPNESPNADIALAYWGVTLRFMENRSVLSSSTAAAEVKKGWTVNKNAREIVATAVSATALSSRY